MNLHTTKNHLLLKSIKYKDYQLWCEIFCKTNPCYYNSKLQFRFVEILMDNSKIFKPFLDYLAPLVKRTICFWEIM